MTVERPLMPITATSEPYWTALKNREIRIQRCQDCQALIFYPREICPHCSGMNFTWEKLSGLGCVYSFTIVRRPSIPAFASVAPYILAIVELAEGIRMTSNIVNCGLKDIRIGMPVRALFEETPQGQYLLLFEPA
jgi:uncharacterized OB-fold protein